MWPAHATPDSALAEAATGPDPGADGRVEAVQSATPPRANHRHVLEVGPFPLHGCQLRLERGDPRPPILLAASLGAPKGEGALEPGSRGRPTLPTSHRNAIRNFTQRRVRFVDTLRGGEAEFKVTLTWGKENRHGV